MKAKSRMVGEKSVMKSVIMLPISQRLQISHEGFFTRQGGDYRKIDDDDDDDMSSTSRVAAPIMDTYRGAKFQIKQASVSSRISRRDGFSKTA